jgi:hypothetical protein
MTESPENLSIPAAELLQALRRKQGTWVEWGQACQTLQKAGYKPQEIFEETGFEPIHQNQVIVGSQVYHSIVSAGVSEAVKTHFGQRASDILYELRILTQPERAAAAEFILSKQLDADDAREVAKAMKDFSRLKSMPDGFSAHPGDIMAYKFWKVAKQKSDLQERSRLIAQGLRYANSQSAREQIEKLLTDLSVEPAKPKPSLPMYRLESTEEVPRMVPIAGTLPLSVEELQAVVPVEETEPFQIVYFSSNQACVPVPGWQIVRQMSDPVGLLSESTQLPQLLPGKPEPVLVIIDRAQTEWDELNYFAVAQENQVQLQWFSEPPDVEILGRVMLILRPKKIFDEEITKDPWQLDE